MKLKLKVHPLFVLYGAYAAVCGRLFSFLSVTAVALLHECGHSLYAASVGYRLDRICLMPYGAVVSGEPQTLRKREEILLCLAGPFTNALTVLFFVSLWWFFPDAYAYTDTAVYASAFVGVSNLLPAYPLDGGRVLFCLTGSRKVCLVCSVLVALGCAALSFPTGNVSFLFFAGFILAGCFGGGGEYRKINFSVAGGLRRGLEIRQVAIGQDAPLRRAFRYLDEKHYLILRVYDERERLVALVDQNRLWTMFKEESGYASFGEICKKNGGFSAETACQGGERMV